MLLQDLIVDFLEIGDVTVFLAHLLLVSFGQLVDLGLESDFAADQLQFLFVASQQPLVLLDLGLAGLDLLVDELHFLHDGVLKCGLLGLDEEVEDLVVVAVDESGLVLVEDADVGLVGLHDVGEEAVVGEQVLFEFAVDELEAVLVVGFGFALEGDDGVDVVDELVLVVAGCLDVVHFLLEFERLHSGIGFYII